MRYSIEIDQQVFDVTIDDTSSRPIIARVNGREYHVNLASDDKTVVEPTMAKTTASTLSATKSTHPEFLTAPLPGTVMEISIKAGDSVNVGQPLLVIEAMKMKNTIRSSVNATVAAVRVTSGEIVTHKQTLIEFQL